MCSPNMSWSPQPADFPCRNPSELIIMHTTQAQIQLTIPLSSLWPCMDTSSVLVLAALSVATCHDPIPPMKGSIGGYTSTVEGSVVAFHCNEGLIPLGKMNTTCASNGSWAPNPAELICNEPSSNSEFSCQWTAMEQYLATLWTQKEIAIYIIIYCSHW